MPDRREAVTCGSLYPGGHGETRECVLPRGHTEAHVYQRDDKAVIADRLSLLLHRCAPNDNLAFHEALAALDSLSLRLQIAEEIANRAVEQLTGIYEQDGPLPEGHWLLEDRAALTSSAEREPATDQAVVAAAKACLDQWAQGRGNPPRLMSVERRLADLTGWFYSDPLEPYFGPRSAEREPEKPCPRCGNTEWIADYGMGGVAHHRIDHCAHCDWPAAERDPESETADAAEGHRPVIESVISDLREREQRGIETYGTTLMPHNGRSALRDAYEEALDLAMYLCQALAEEKGLIENRKEGQHE